MPIVGGYHAKVICDGCGRTEEVATSGMVAVVRQMRKAGWGIHSLNFSTANLSTRCPKCRKPQGRKAVGKWVAAW